MEPYLDNPSRKAESLSPYHEAESAALSAAKYEADAKTLRKQKARRVCRVLHGLALLTLVTYLASRYIPFSALGLGCHHKDKALVQAIQHIGDWDYDVPRRTKIVQCTSSEDWKPSDFAEDTQDSLYPSEVSFDLPLDAAKLFLLSRGRSLGGKVTFDTSEDQASDKATVNVKVYYHSEEALDWTKVCLLESVHGKNESGIGIFTPIWKHGGRRDWKKRRLNYAMTVTFPTAAPGEEPHHIKSLETDLPNTSLFLESLDGNVAFGDITLTGTNGVVRIESLTTLHGTILTTNGKITGHINATDFLAVMTTNSPIALDINFTRDKQENSTLTLRTTNSPLTANINLLSSNSSEGAFYVTTATTNGPLAVNFVKSPVDSTLKFAATTTNSPAKVSLDTAYEGTFNLVTSRWFEPSVHYRPDEEDPSGKGRKRVSFSTGGRGYVTGSTRWGTDGKPELQGSVIVSTTNGPVSLEL